MSMVDVMLTVNMPGVDHEGCVMFNHEPNDYHVHVFPRHAGDGLYGSRPYPDFVTAEQRRPYADKLREHFGPAAPH